jgi:tetratricopeptide (TPR) repeat protein
MLPRGRIFTLSWALAALWLAPGPHTRLWPAAAPTTQGAAARPEKIALFGVDAGDWRVIDRLVASGRLPTFARLKQVASLGTLRADPPLLSPLIWTTIATGRPPEDHGVLDFMVDVPGGGQAPVTGGARRVKALWEIWSDAGRRVQVTGWWATWPADHVRGLVASDRLATPHLVERVRPDAGLVFPATSLAEMARLVVEPEAIDYAGLSRLIPVTREEFARASAATRASPGRLYRDPLAHFRAAVAAARTYRAISTKLAGSLHPDFWAVYFEVVDTASHLFALDRARSDRAIAAAYAEVDDALRDAAAALDPDTLLLVVSDHGFQPADAGVREDPADLTAGATAWHRPYGIVAATTAGALAGTRPAPGFPRPLGTVSPLDIAPTVLARAGLAVAADMPGRIIPALAPATAPTRIASYGAHVLPDAPTASRPAASDELERLKALGYVSGAAATTSLARVNLGEILCRKSDFRGAARELEAVMRVDPLNGRASLWLARAYIGLGRRDDARTVYDRLVQAAAVSPVALDPVAVLAATDNDLAAGRADLARARLGRVPAAVRATTECQVAEGAVMQAEGRAADAEARYRAALHSSPSDFEALQRLMDLLIARQRPSEAAAVTAAAARTFPESAQHLSLAGEAALATRSYQDAARHFAAALVLAPDSSAVRLDLARAQLLGGRPEAALDTLGQSGSSKDVETVRGAASTARGDWPAAIASFERALALGPASPELLNALGAAQLEAGRRPDAVRSLERSLALDPNQPAARALLQRARGR